MSQLSLFSTPRKIRFQDIDAAGIIFFAKVFDLFHDAYSDCLQAGGVPLFEVLAKGVWIAPIVHAEADYRQPLRFGDEITVEITSAQLKERSMVIEYALRHSSGLVYVTGKTAHVFVEKASMRPCPVPDEVRAVFMGEKPVF